MSTETPEAPVPAAVTLVKVSLDAKQVTLLLGVADIYSRRFLALQDKKILAAKTVEEQKNFVYDSVMYSAAASELIGALSTMVEEGMYRASNNNFDAFDVLFQPAEITFLVSILSNDMDTVTAAAVASGKYTQAEADAAHVLLNTTIKSLGSGVAMSLDEVKAMREEAKKTTPFLFEQNKVGLA